MKSAAHRDGSPYPRPSNLPALLRRATSEFQAFILLRFLRLFAANPLTVFWPDRGRASRPWRAALISAYRDGFPQPRPSILPALPRRATSEFQLGGGQTAPRDPFRVYLRYGNFVDIAEIATGGLEANGVRRVIIKHDADVVSRPRSPGPGRCKCYPGHGTIHDQISGTPGA